MVVKRDTGQTEGLRRLHTKLMIAKESLDTARQLIKRFNLEGVGTVKADYEALKTATDTLVGAVDGSYKTKKAEKQIEDAKTKKLKSN